MEFAPLKYRVNVTTAFCTNTTQLAANLSNCLAIRLLEDVTKHWLLSSFPHIFQTHSLFQHTIVASPPSTIQFPCMSQEMAISVTYRPQIPVITMYWLPQSNHLYLHCGFNVSLISSKAQSSHHNKSEVIRIYQNRITFTKYCECVKATVTVLFKENGLSLLRQI